MIHEANDLSIHEDFIMFDPDDGDIKNGYRAWYDSDECKITYNIHYITAGIFDIIDTIVHEWQHALFDWATLGDPNELAFNLHDCTGDSDHFIMKIINFAD